jgi:hypothetical protein
MNQFTIDAHAQYALYDNNHETELRPEFEVKPGINVSSSSILTVLYGEQAV